MPDPLRTLIVGRGRAILEPTRMRIIELLLPGEESTVRELTVQDITDELPTSHQNVSQHLNTLFMHGIVTSRKEGNHTCYALQDFDAWRIVEMLGEGVLAKLDERRDLFTVPANPERPDGTSG